MSGPFRLGFVGTGLITTEAHLPAALAFRDIHVAALVDPVPARAEKLADAWNIRPRVASDLRDVLRELDGVVIATPNHTHCALAVACLEAGVHVLIEKPLATTVAAGESIAAAAKRNGRTVAVGYSTRFQDNMLLMRELLLRKFFGRVRRFAYQFGVIGGWSSMSGFHLDRASVGGGALVTVGTHFLDRMLSWFGYPDEVSLEDDSRGGPEANVLARVRYRTTGVEGTVRLSKTVALPAGSAIETERGLVLLRDDAAAPLRLRPADAPDLEWRLDRAAGSPFPAGQSVFQRQLADFVRACRGGGDPMIPVEQGIAVIRLVEELYARRTPMSDDWYTAARRMGS